MAGNHETIRDDQFEVLPRRSRLASFGLAALLVGALAVGAACGSDSAGDSAAGADTSPEAVAVANGEALSRSKGCAGCHGQDFDGGAGPGWIGLAGSEVVLVDGTTLIADDAYLTRAIAEPSADLIEGYNLQMPANNLTDAEVADIVAFINSLADG